MNIKERMKLKAAKKTSGKKSVLRDKFKKRSQTVLDKTYDDRNQRSKGAMGKSIFNEELMEQYGIEEFSPTAGDHFFEILPISLSPTIPYFREISIHFSVGFTNDAFICMQRHQIGGNKRCFRCETQAKMWKKQELYKKDDIVALYPVDRACYLLWERTKELVDGESPDFTFKLWASPKIKVHSEIQEKTRNKISHQTLDISDVSVDSDGNGDGRTVSFTIVKQGDFPDYKAFDLLTRDEPIPDEVLEKLDEIITASEEQGYKNCIEMFFDLPEYNDIKESMETEMEDDLKDDPSIKSPASRTSLKQKQQTNEDQMEKEDDAFMEELNDFKHELEAIGQKPLLWKKWCKENDYEDALQMDTLEAIDAIIDDMYEKFVDEQNTKYNKKTNVTEDDIPY